MLAENEWVFTARGGLIEKKYVWGNDESVARDYANYTGIDGKDKWGYCTLVGSFKPNGYGLYDMSGNSWELCQNWYDSSQRYHVFRGGSWGSSAYYFSVDRRVIAHRNDAELSGFRCVAGLK